MENTLSLKTITTDCLLGEYNPEFKGLIKKYENLTEELLKQWVQECYELGIESTSVWGALFQIFTINYTGVVIDLEYQRQQGELME